MAEAQLNKMKQKAKEKSIIGTIIDYLVRIENISIIVLFIIMTIITFLQVLFRYVFKISAPWTEELGRYIMIWLIFIGAAWAIHAEDHVDINVLGLITKNTKIINYLGALVTLILTIFSIYYLYSAYAYILQVFNSHEVTIGTGIPMWIPQFCLVVGGFLIAFHCLELFFKKILVLLGGGR